MLALIMLAAAAASGPKLGDLHTFKDWIVGCDNTATCQANALMPENADGDDPLMLVLTRDGDANAPALLLLDAPDKTPPGTRLTVTIDGKAVASVVSGKDAEIKLPLTRAQLHALDAGQRLAFGGRSATLAGLSAAMLYIDDRQHRTGTIGALKAVGPRPDSTVPPPPAAPVIRTPASDSRPPRTLSVAQATRLIGPDAVNCPAADHDGKVAPEAYRLDAGHSLVLVPLPCGNGAYNFFTNVYVLDEAGHVQPAKFDFNPGMGEANDPAPNLTNGDWDPKARTLSSYEKGRGLGDCGGTETYAWDGTRFRLTEATMMGECRGSNDFIRVWTARTAP